MTPAALSRLTWTADDRRAWNEAYRHARAIDRRRKRRERTERDRERYLREQNLPPLELHSVHADILAAREDTAVLYDVLAREGVTRDA